MEEKKENTNESLKDSEKIFREPLFSKSAANFNLEVESKPVKQAKVQGNQNEELKPPPPTVDQVKEADFKVLQSRISDISTKNEVFEKNFFKSVAAEITGLKKNVDKVSKAMAAFALELKKQSDKQSEFAQNTNEKLDIISEPLLDDKPNKILNQKVDSLLNSLKKIDGIISENKESEIALSKAVEIEEKINTLVDKFNNDISIQVKSMKKFVDEIELKHKREDDEQAKIEEDISEIRTKIVPMKYMEESLKELEGKLKKTSEYDAEVFLCLRKLEKIELSLLELKNQNKENEVKTYSFSSALVELESKLSCTNTLLNYVRGVVEKNQEAHSNKY